MPATSEGLTRMADGVFELRLPVPIEDGLVNVFLFPDGANIDLLDTGIGTELSNDLLAAAVRELAGSMGRLRRLVLTHVHRDHYGGAASAVAHDGAELLAHRLELPLIDFHYSISAIGLERFLATHGVPAQSVEVILGATASVRDSVTLVRPSALLDGGETIAMGARRLTVVWTPGHTPGHICLYDRDAQLLFAGDHVLPELTPNVTLDPVSMPNPLADYLASLRSVAQLTVERVLPAHGRPYGALASRCHELVAHHERRKEVVLSLITPREAVTAWQVAERLWDIARLGYHRRLALQEALAHMQALSVEGRIEKSFAAGAIRWTRR
jgi:glyoxylase-like metal-dependent hydrolase (beta-lactamase superfamily II)